MINTYEDFKTEFLRLSDIDLSMYQEHQMKRRIDDLISKMNLKDYGEYYELILRDEEKLKEFLDYITINVSEFFRTKDQWNFMEENALKDLFSKKKCINVWSIACSTGEEPYSILMSVMEKYPDNDINLIATDINEKILKKAERGCFSPKQMESVPENLRNKYFDDKESYFEVKDFLRKKVHFMKMNLLKFDYPKEMDFIIARNILIYFTGDAKDKAYHQFFESLLPGGYLFTGNTEQIIYYKNFGYVKIRPFLYRKPQERRDIMSNEPMEVNLGKRTVLIVEDNEINREILSSILGNEYNILTAENGQEGYDILSKEYRNISCILLDVFMPVMNGFEFLEKIKDDVLLSSVPVIVTTASDKPSDEVTCLKLGASDFVTKPYNAEVVKGRLHSIIKLHESVVTLSAVEFDELTGLYTMPAFYHHAAEMIRLNPDKNFDMDVADIKNFKLVNNLFGEEKGNELLKYIADNYKRELPFGIIGRSGDNFYTLSEDKYRFSPEVGKKYYEEMITNSPITSLIVKYGIYSDVDKSLPIRTMCNRALWAAQSIKNDFTRSIAFYDDGMESKLIENQKLEDSFNDAILNKEFVAYYQPKVDAGSGKIVAAEALVRWFKDGKMVSPGAFIPLFEKDGLVTRLDEYIFNTVCEYQKKRMDEGKRIVPISINLSRNSIYSRNIEQRYRKIVEDLGISIDNVPIEITESATTEGIGVRNLADMLVREGFSLHMDDFGTGYSSLSSLAEMPFDVMKIDKSLIDRIGNEKGNILIKHIIRIAQEMGMKVVAEGVEMKSQWDFLKSVGCDMIQGFYFSAPKNEEFFSEMLDKAEEDILDIHNEYKNIHVSEKLVLDERDLKIMKFMADEMMEGFFVYKATSDETILYANKKMIEMTGCDSMDDFRKHTSNSFRGIVDKDDYDAVEKSIFSQINSNEEKNDAVEYHIIKKDGSKIFVMDEGHCRYTKTYGNVFYVFIKEK